MFPTSYPEVNAVLEYLLAPVREILGDRFVGLYLYGSLAAGDFRPDRSDIDFVVVTDGKLPEAMVAALESMHASLAASSSPWAKKLEGAYVPKHELRRHSPDYPPRPTVNEGRFYLAGEDSDWILDRYVLREYETIMAGPSLRGLIDPVRPEDLRRAVREVLQLWWKPMLHTPQRLKDPGYQPYAVLSMCRALYTLEHGTIVSKTQAAKWALRTLDPRWAALIERALAWREGRPSGNIEETLRFMAYAIEHGIQ
jgi:hypothetical protein